MRDGKEKQLARFVMTLKTETAAKVMFSLLTEFSRDLSG